MENAAHTLLQSAVHRTLHASSFSRSSTQASLVLADLLSRYLTLLSSTCAKHAQHAGRTRLSPRDAISALEELGVSLEELNEYGSSEGKELGRYAIHSVRRVEELNEFRGQPYHGFLHRLFGSSYLFAAQLTVGLEHDGDDLISLQYAPYTTPPPEDKEDEMESDEDAEGVDEGFFEDPAEILVPQPIQPSPIMRKRSPLLPPSPISNPGSPRKRPRTLDWQPPPHVPDFLPPFPTEVQSHPASPSAPISPRVPQVMPPPVQIENVKVEKPPSPIPQLTTASASDYLVRVPYPQSSLSTVSEWHLPSSPPPPAARLPTQPGELATERTFLQAYHYILKNPPSANPNAANPARHKVAMALISQLHTGSRWTPPDTLYSSIAPTPVRHAPIGPTFPVPLGDPSVDGKGRIDKDVKFPTTLPRSVSTIERISPLVSQQSSRIPDLARQVLPVSIRFPTPLRTILYRLPYSRQSTLEPAACRTLVFSIVARRDLHMVMAYQRLGIL